MALRALSVLLLAWLSLSAQAPELPRGEIIPRVFCVDSPRHSYALYLPSNFTPEKAWPVLFGFSPAGEGRGDRRVLALQLARPPVRPAAEPPP